MNMPGAPSVFFLAYLLIVLPWVAFRSGRRMEAVRRGNGSGAAISRKQVWASTLYLQIVLLGLTFITASSFDYSIFAMPSLSIRDCLAAVAALVACFVLRWISRAIRTTSERRGMMIYFIAPRTAEERTIRTITVLVTGVAEEAAYRGVAMSILWYSLGNPWVAAIISAVAFALAHRLQGWKPMGIVFLIALVMQGLVQFTGTLVLAMIVHAVFDVVAGMLIERDAHRFDAETTAAT